MIKPRDAINLRGQKMSMKGARAYIKTCIRLAVEHERPDIHPHKSLFSKEVEDQLVLELRDAGYTVTNDEYSMKIYFPQHMWDEVDCREKKENSESVPG